MTKSEAARARVEETFSSGVQTTPLFFLQNLEQAEKIILFKLNCDRYETGVIPNDYKVYKTITVPKKVESDKCENYRTISLTTHASKILTTIIYIRCTSKFTPFFIKNWSFIVKERNLMFYSKYCPLYYSSCVWHES